MFEKVLFLAVLCYPLDEGAADDDPAGEGGKAPYLGRCRDAEADGQRILNLATNAFG